MFDFKRLLENREGRRAVFFDQEVSVDIWDKTTLLERHDHQNDYVSILVEMFIEAQPERIQRLEEAFGKKNCSRINNIAHEIKGVARTLNASRLFTTSDALYAATKDASWQDVCRLVEQLIAESAQLSDQLKSHVQTL